MGRGPEAKVFRGFSKDESEGVKGETGRGR